MNVPVLRTAPSYTPTSAPYRTYWSLLDKQYPSRTLRTDHAQLLEPSPELTQPIDRQMYIRDVVFTTGTVDANDHYIVASDGADLACRITHIPKQAIHAL